MSNPKKDTKTITDLKKVAGGATAATVETSGGSPGAGPTIDVFGQIGHVPGVPGHNLGVELADVSAGATAPAPSTKTEPQLPKAPQKNITSGNLSYEDLGNASAGATAVVFGSVPNADEPQIPEVFPGPSKSAKGSNPSIQNLGDMSAGATSPGVSYGGAGPALPNKPKLNIDSASAVSVEDLGNASAGATSPGASYGGAGPALPNKPKLNIDSASAVSVEDLGNTSAGATAPGASTSGAAPSTPSQPKVDFI